MSEFWNKNILRQVKIVFDHAHKHGYRATIEEIKKRIKNIYYPDIIFDIQESEYFSNLNFVFEKHHINLVFPKFLEEKQYTCIISIFEEIFNRQIYKNLDWDRILDIWGYYGESAIYLHTTNPDANIYVYEAQKTCFEYIKTNCDHDNIYCYNNIVTWNWNRQDLWIADDWLCDAKAAQNNGYISSDFSYPEAIDIQTIIQNHDPDCIKIDIEWWEYNIVNDFTKIPKLLQNINNGIIEFHDLHDLSKVDIFLNFGKLLSKLWYKYKYINSKSDYIDLNQVMKDWIVNLYFYR